MAELENNGCEILYKTVMFSYVCKKKKLEKTFVYGRPLHLDSEHSNASHNSLSDHYMFPRMGSCASQVSITGPVSV